MKKTDDEYKDHVTHLKQSPSGIASPENAIKLYQVLRIMHEIHSVHLSCLSPLKILELFPAVVTYSLQSDLHLQVVPVNGATQTLKYHTAMKRAFQQWGSQRRYATKEDTA